MRKKDDQIVKSRSTSLNSAVPPRQCSVRGNDVHTNLTTQMSTQTGSTSPLTVIHNDEERKATIRNAVPSADVNPSDILLGRGVPMQRHPGNIRMHYLINTYRHRYRKSSRSEKASLIHEVLQRLKVDGSRFRRRLDDSDFWVEVSDQVAYDKISHALRGRGSERRAPPCDTETVQLDASTTKVETAKMEQESFDARGQGKPSHEPVSAHNALRSPFLNRVMPFQTSARNDGLVLPLNTPGLIDSTNFGSPSMQQLRTLQSRFLPQTDGVLPSLRTATSALNVNLLSNAQLPLGDFSQLQTVDVEATNPLAHLWRTKQSESIRSLDLSSQRMAMNGNSQSNSNSIFQFLLQKQLLRHATQSLHSSSRLHLLAHLMGNSSTNLNGLLANPLPQQMNADPSIAAISNPFLSGNVGFGHDSLGFGIRMGLGQQLSTQSSLGGLGTGRSVEFDSRMTQSIPSDVLMAMLSAPNHVSQSTNEEQKNLRP